MVVFDDVDTDAAVKTVMNGLLTNGGQICTAHSRLIVHKNMAPKLMPALKTALEQVEFATSPLEDEDGFDCISIAGVWEDRSPVEAKIGGAIMRCCTQIHV